MVGWVPPSSICGSLLVFLQQSVHSAFVTCKNLENQYQMNYLCTSYCKVGNFFKPAYKYDWLMVCPATSTDRAEHSNKSVLSIATVLLGFPTINTTLHVDSSGFLNNRIAVRFVVHCFTARTAVFGRQHYGAHMKQKLN